MTHPFHPRCGREYVVVAVRSTWGEDRVFFLDEEATLRSLPLAWTDAGEFDPFVVVAAGRSAFRVADLLAVAALLDGFGRSREAETPCRDGSPLGLAAASPRLRRATCAPSATIARIPLAATPDASWSLNPGAILVVATLTVVYVRRWREVDGSAWRLLSFLGGMALILVALVSPVDRLAEQLFFMHMTQHLLLLDLAPILVLLGLTKVILRPMTRRLVRVEQASGPLAHPAFAIGLYVVVMWTWHIPALYDAALEYPAIHVTEHVLFAVAGGLYWWHLLSPIRARKRLGGMGPVVYMASTKVLVGILGIFLAFAPAAIYAFYEDQPRYWGLSAGTDQAIGGLIMATEQSIVMGIALAYLFIRALAEADRENEREERYEQNSPAGAPR